jgi:hypothetical protein
MPRYFFDVTNSNTLGKNSNLFKPREDMLWQRPGNCHDTNCRAPLLGTSSRSDEGGVFRLCSASPSRAHGSRVCALPPPTGQ